MSLEGAKLFNPEHRDDAGDIAPDGRRGGGDLLEGALRGKDPVGGLSLLPGVFVVGPGGKPGLIACLDAFDQRSPLGKLLGCRVRWRRSRRPLGIAAHGGHRAPIWAPGKFGSACRRHDSTMAIPRISTARRPTARRYPTKATLCKLRSAEERTCLRRLCINVGRTPPTLTVLGPPSHF
jgi:hypothetical protein